MEAIAEVAQEVMSLILGSRCENCGFGYRHRDSSGLRKWCLRCIDVYNRRQQLSEYQIGKKIMELVEPLYYEATIETLEQDIQDKLSELKPGQDVFMFGPIGTGKTHGMAAQIRKYVCEGYLCERINFDSFCVKVRSTFAPAAKETAWELTEELKNVDKLFIDDLGLRSNPESQFVYDTFYDILNKRQERILPTFISSNKNIAQLGQTFDARIASRLHTALVIEMKGKDRRIAGANYE
ncbi:MAG: ATP-binding protein [Planctomycetes bacterium]|nr:ATP-binding protein [Planctomycetota bacterium]